MKAFNVIAKYSKDKKVAEFLEKWLNTPEMVTAFHEAFDIFAKPVIMQEILIGIPATDEQFDLAVEQCVKYVNIKTGPKPE